MIEQYDWQEEICLALDMLVMAKNMSPSTEAWRYFFDEEVMKRTDDEYIEQ